MVRREHGRGGHAAAGSEPGRNPVAGPARALAPRRPRRRVGPRGSSAPSSAPCPTSTTAPCTSRWCASRPAGSGQGHLPLTSWFPYLGLGSPQFLHYQSLPAMTVGLIGTVADPDTVFRWSLYLLLALWPLAIYWSARLFGLGRWTAAAAAAVSPFLASAAGIGYETKAYVWVGLRRVDAAVGVVDAAAGVGLHLPRAVVAARRVPRRPLHHGDGRPALRDRLPRLRPAGGLALPGSVRPLASAGRAWPSVRRAGRLGLGHRPAAGPVALGGAQPDPRGHRPGERLRRPPDAVVAVHRPPLRRPAAGPVVTILSAWDRRVHRALAQFRGRPGPRRHLGGHPPHDLRADDVGRPLRHLPGSSDIFIRRFQMGVQLSGILLAGVGLVTLGLCCGARAPVPRGTRERAAEPRARPRRRAVHRGARLVLSPAWSEHGHLRRAQRDQHRAAGRGRCTSRTRRSTSSSATSAPIPRGRVYAGRPTNWGMDFIVGAVPVFKYLESKDVDEVGYTLRTASLMTDPEYFFDDTNPGDYPLFGIGYLIIPEAMSPPVPAHEVECARATTACGRCPTPGYIHVYDTTGVAHGDPGRRRHAERDAPRLAAARRAARPHGRLQRAAGLRPTAAGARGAQGSPGQVVAEHADLANGQAHAVVTTNRRATVVLSASYDPGWTATVDGRPAPTVMVAPALVASSSARACTPSASLRRVRVLHRAVRPHPRGAGDPRASAPIIWRRTRGTTTV